MRMNIEHRTWPWFHDQVEQLPKLAIELRDPAVEATRLLPQMRARLARHQHAQMVTGSPTVDGLLPANKTGFGALDSCHPACSALCE